MGAVTVELASLLERKGEPLRKWYALDTGGAIEVIAQWRHSPTNAWKPFAAPKFPEKAPNELRVGLSQGRELAVKDKNLLSRIQCPYLMLRRRPPRHRRDVCSTACRHGHTRLTS